jgi:hypothetical protein
MVEIHEDMPPLNPHTPAPVIPACTVQVAPHFDASLLSSADFGVAAGAGGRASGVAGGCVVELVVGPGSD